MQSAECLYIVVVCINDAGINFAACRTMTVGVKAVSAFSFFAAPVVSVDRVNNVAAMVFAFIIFIFRITFLIYTD